MARKRIIKNRNRSSNQIPKLLMISLAFNDLIYRLFISPLGVSDNMENGVWDYGWDACYARIFFIYYQFCVSICHINSMAIDRYIAVCKPLLYRLLTNKSGYLLIGCSWGFPAFMQLVPHVLDWAHVEGTKIFKCNGKECAEIYSTTSFIVLIVLGFCIPFFTPYCFYVFILKEVIMFNRRRPDFPLRSEETNDASIQSRETNPTNRNMKAYRTVGAIILCFSLCWCPVWIILSQFFNARDPIPPWFNVLTNALSNMNPALNPLLYCLNRPVRQAIKSILCRSKCKIL
ncbi:unnamed protein product [Lymnaea stagnalis]|uniref:G-protein coupled receptors family 1 profile domain-containing protein n=1 Tax=Lymnaea stagnalis TaxID=6523 RepID=A0AAV2HWI1_LYMST